MRRPGIARRAFLPWLLLGTAGALAAFAAWRRLAVPSPADSAAAAMRRVVTGRFTLVDHAGRTVTEKTYRGKWLLVYFGYTNCPDVCPLTLDLIARILELLDDRAGKLQPLFVTVDPERDDPERLGRYLSRFDRRIVGLTGTAEQVRAAARAFRVRIAPPLAETRDEPYTVDHSAFIYLMNPAGSYEAVFRHEEGAERIAAAIRDRL